MENYPEIDFLKEAEKEKENFLKDLATLIAARSVKGEPEGEGAPFGKGIRKALDELLEIGKRDGFAVEDVDGYAGVVRMGEGDQSVGILAHLDTVPYGDGWTYQPDALTIVDDKLYGRGVLDDKGPLLAAYYAMKILKKLGIPLKKEVRLIAGTDEESGMGGIKYYRKHGRIPDEGFTPDAEFPLIYAEKGTMQIRFDSDAPTVIESFETDPQINVVISRAQAWINSDRDVTDLLAFFCAVTGVEGDVEYTDGKTRIRMKGEAAHASLPYLGNNAGAHLLHFIATVYNDTLSRDLWELFNDWKGAPLGIYTEGFHMGLLTMNLGRIEKKDHETRVWIDIRYPDDLTAGQIEQSIAKALDGRESDIRFTVERMERPLFVDPDSKFVADLLDSYRKYTGDVTTPPMAIGGGTYAKCFDNFVAYGPARIHDEPLPLGGCHQPDEGILTQDLIDAIAIYADAILKMAA